MDRHGRTTTFTYTDADSDSDNDDILEIETYDGRTLTFAYTSDRVSSITDFDGREVLFTYDGDDQLETIEFPDPDDAGPLDALVSTYTYVTGTSYLETADDNGKVTEFTYNALGALSARENPDGTTEAFQDVSTLPLISSDLILVDNLLSELEDEDGESTTHVLGPLGLPIKSIDALGNETTYVRDADGRVTYQTDPDPDGAGGQPAPITSFVYDAAGNLIQKTLPDSTVLTWDYDPTWNVPISYTDERGLLTVYDVNFTTGLVGSERRVIGEIDDLINLETDDIVTEYTYTAAPSGPTDPPAGLMETMTDPLGRVTVYTYNARGDVTSVTYADGTADEATTYTYYNSDGTIDYELDELSRRTDYDYDLLGRLILKTLPDPDGGDPLPRPEIEYEYDVWNRLVKEIDPLERETIYTYDNRGRQTKVERPDHDGDKSLTTTTTKYNDRGLVESITDPLGRETTFEYDKLGRQTKVILPEIADPTTAVSEVQIIDFDSGTEGTFKLNGNSKDGIVDLADLSDLQSILDGIWGAGNTSATYTSTEATITFKGDLSGTDIAQMTISDITGTKGATPFVSTDTVGVAASLVNPTTETEYDPLGRVISTKDALGKVTTYEYTNYGQNLKITLPDPDGVGGKDAPVMYQVFDESGNLISETDANSNVTTRDYDILGRLTKITQANPGDGAPVTEYQYDMAGNLRFVIDPLGHTTEYQYDNRHRQVKVISPDPDGTGSLSALITETVYDDAGQVSEQIAPDGGETVYGYDGLGRTISVTAPDPDGKGILTGPVTKYAYDSAGQMIAMIDPMENETVYGYDLLGNQILAVYSDPDGEGLLDAPLTYREYDAAGQLLSESQGLAKNEIQRLYFGSKASPVSIISDSSNYFSLTFDGYSTSSTILTASDAQNYLQGLSNIGYGNIVVTEAPGGMIFLFRGELGEQDQPQITTSNYVRTTDGVGLSVSNIQPAISGSSEKQLLGLGGATTGTFEINGSATVYSLDTYGIQSALDSIFGSGNTSVYLNFSNVYEITFQGSLANQNISELSVSSNSTDGSPSFSTDTQGNAGQHQIDQFSLVGSPDTGNWLPLLNSAGGSTPVGVDASVGTVQSLLNYMFYPLSFSVTSPSSGVWTVETLADTSPGSWSFQTSGFYSVEPLARTVGIEIAGIQNGGLDWWNTTTYEYDALGRLIKVTAPDPDGAGGVAAPVTHYEYDLNGNQTKVRDSLQFETTYEYDFLNRRTVSRDALGGETTFAYDDNGNLLSLTDPVGNETTWIYDALNRVTQETNELGKHRYFTYDAAGNLIQKEDRLGRFTVYEYDNLQRQIAEEWWEDDAFPAVGVSTSTEGGGGNDEVQVVTLSNTTGGTFRLGFGGNWSAALDWDATTGEIDSALESLSGANTISVSGSAGGPWTITFIGDYANQNVAPLFYRANDLTNADLVRVIAYTFNDDGDLEQVSDPDAVYDYIYDGLGRVTSFVQSITGLNPEIKFESVYNAASRRTELQAWFDSTKDFRNTYTYDNMQRLSVMVQQTASGGNVVAPKRIEFNYNEISQYTSINRYAATSATEFVAASYYFYDDMNRLTKLVHSESTTAPTSGWGTDPLAGYEYAYDAGSRILAIDSYLDGLSEYVHDDTYQLLAADHASMTDESYEYDANGNRIMSGYDVDPNNQLYSDGTYNYTYDDEGNRLTRTKISNGYVTRYEWDFRNRLTKVIEEDDSNNVLQVTEQHYDAFNQWIRRRWQRWQPVRGHLLRLRNRPGRPGVRRRRRHEPLAPLRLGPPSRPSHRRRASQQPRQRRRRSLDLRRPPRHHPRSGHLQQHDRRCHRRQPPRVGFVRQSAIAIQCHVCQHNRLYGPHVGYHDGIAVEPSPVVRRCGGQMD